MYLLHPSEWSHRPSSQIHVEYAGPFMEKVFLLITDAHSIWVDIQITNSSNIQTTVEKLRKTFDGHGLCEIAATMGNTTTVSSYPSYIMMSERRYDMPKNRQKINTTNM